MAKRPLLRGDWVNPVAATLLSLALSTHLYATRAFGEGNDAAPGAAASDAKPAEQTPEESKRPAEDAAKEQPAVKAAEPNEAKPQAPLAGLPRRSRKARLGHPREV